MPTTPGAGSTRAKLLERRDFPVLARLVLKDLHLCLRSDKMQTSQAPVWARDHTILGVCEALGEDFGFNPLLLRVPLAVCLLLNPWAVTGTYVALGVLVAFTRMVSPNPRRGVVPDQPAAEPASARVCDNDEHDMAIAA
jgi:phage shock protein PspC (stress-responsive transcriptional regulator)